MLCAVHSSHVSPRHCSQFRCQRCFFCACESAWHHVNRLTTLLTFVRPKMTQVLHHVGSRLVYRWKVDRIDKGKCIFLIKEIWVFLFILQLLTAHRSVECKVNGTCCSRRTVNRACFLIGGGVGVWAKRWFAANDEHRWGKGNNGNKIKNEKKKHKTWSKINYFIENGFRSFSHLLLHVPITSDQTNGVANYRNDYLWPLDTWNLVGARAVPFNSIHAKLKSISHQSSFATKSGYVSGIRVTDAGLISTQHIYSDEKSITIFVRSQRQ